MISSILTYLYNMLESNFVKLILWWTFYGEPFLPAE